MVTLVFAIFISLLLTSSVCHLAAHQIFSPATSCGEVDESSKSDNKNCNKTKTIS